MKIRLNEDNIRAIVRNTLRRVLAENSMDELVGYQGTTAVFDKFDLKYVGSGEGSQQYGYGVYVTENIETGKMYAQITGINQSSKGAKASTAPKTDLERCYGMYKKAMRLASRVNTYPSETKTDVELFRNNRHYTDEQRQEISDAYKKSQQALNMSPKERGEAMSAPFMELGIKYGNIYVKMAKKSKYLYTVDIPDGPYLFWDESDSRKVNDIYNLWQEKFPEEMSAINVSRSDLKSFSTLFEKVRGFKNARKATPQMNEWQKKLSLALQDLGYIGIKVVIGRQKGINGDGRGLNFVIFDANDVKIISREKVD